MRAYTVRSIRVSRVDRDTAALHVEVHEAGDGEDTIELTLGREQFVTVLRDVLTDVLADWRAE